MVSSPPYSVLAPSVSVSGGGREREGRGRLLLYPRRSSQNDRPPELSFKRRGRGGSFLAPEREVEENLFRIQQEAPRPQ